jgi:hypothetical protein
MDTGAFFLASLFGMFFGTMFLAAYLYAGYRFGVRMGERAPAGRRLWQGAAGFALVWAPLSSWPFLAGWNPFLATGAAMAFFLLHAYPMSIGYGVALDARAKEASRRFRKNVDDWLGEWECVPALSEEDPEAGREE